MKTSRIIIPMEPGLVAAIDARAKAEKRSRAAMIRIMLEDVLADPETLATIAPTTTQAPQHPDAHTYKARPGTLRCITCGIPRGQHT